MNGRTEACRIGRERRTAPRKAVLLLATLERQGASNPVRMVNLSQSGSSVIGQLPAKHCSVVFRRNAVALRGRMAWSDGGRGGIDFEESIEPSEMLRSIPEPRVLHYYPAGRPPLRNPHPGRAERENMERIANLLGIGLPAPTL
jgi:hypothetical protein